MSHRSKQCSRSKPRHEPWLLAVRILSVVALGVSAYLAWVSLANGRLPGCGPESGCDAVLHSRWSYWLGLPVSLGAVLTYGVLVATTFGSSARTPAPVQRKVWNLAVFTAVVVVGAAAWFVGLQLLVIKAFCPYCMTVHACGSLSAVLILLKVPLRPPPRKSWQFQKEVFVTWPMARRLALAAIAVVTLLAAGQSLFQPRPFAVQPLAAVTGTSTTLRLISQQADNPKGSNETGRVALPDRPGGKMVQRILQLHGDAFQLDLQRVPLRGRPDAPHVIVHLFDYTCRYCRGVHKYLVEAHRALSNQLAIVNLPAPLEPVCNPLMKRHLPEHTNAFLYAQIGLAVWRANRGEMEAFDDWMFSFPRPPSLEEARRHAAELVGTNAFAQASKDPWIDQQVRQGVDLFNTNYLRSRIGQLPQLIIGTNIVSGTFRSVQDIYRLLSNHLGMSVPAPANP